MTMTEQLVRTPTASAQRTPVVQLAGAICWILSLGCAFASVAGVYLFRESSATFLFGLLAPLALVHGLVRYGWSNLLIFFLITVFVSNVYENASIITGFPFGEYHYTRGPLLLHVPIAIGPVYFAIGYTSWQVASLLLDRADLRLDKKVNMIALPLVAAFVMTMFDLATDPTASTLQQQWVWHKGGGFFGVPYTNFLGWLLTTWTFFQLFALWLWARHGRTTVNEAPNLLVQPLVAYASLGLNCVFLYLTASPANVTDAAGRVLRRTDIYEASLLCAVFTILFVSILVAIKLLRGDLREVK